MRVKEPGTCRASCLQEQTHALHAWLHRYPQTRQRYQAYLDTIGVSSGTHKHLRVVISEPTQKLVKTIACNSKRVHRSICGVPFS